jgi:hypothetical protein
MVFVVFIMSAVVFKVSYELLNTLMALPCSCTEFVLEFIAVELRLAVIAWFWASPASLAEFAKSRVASDMPLSDWFDVITAKEVLRN